MVRLGVDKFGGYKLVKIRFSKNRKQELVVSMQEIGLYGDCSGRNWGMARKRKGWFA